MSRQHFTKAADVEVSNSGGLIGKSVKIFLIPVSFEAKLLMEGNISLNDIQKLDSHFLNMVKAEINKKYKEVTGHLPNGYSISFAANKRLIMIYSIY